MEALKNAINSAPQPSPLSQSPQLSARYADALDGFIIWWIFFDILLSDSIDLGLSEIDIWGGQNNPNPTARSLYMHELILSAILAFAAIALTNIPIILLAWRAAKKSLRQPPPSELSNLKSEILSH